MTDETPAIPEEIMARHAEWFEAERAAYRRMRPPPIGAWDGSSWYRKIEESTRGFLAQLRPKADAWWAERGYAIDWSGREPTVVPIARQEEGERGVRPFESIGKGPSAHMADPVDGLRSRDRDHGR